MNFSKIFLIFFFLSTYLTFQAFAYTPKDCDKMMVWDIGMGMCMPLPMDDMPMKMLMLHGNAFAVGITEQGSRGRTGFAAPNMFMADLGSSLGNIQYWNLDFMGTLEKWTFPPQGYPQLFQMGELDHNNRPYIDSQHPHSSPVMGLTLSDTIRLGTGGEKDHLKLSFSPRGESTDGPVAFMHRETGAPNPDVPLGHHIGQDVGHISSTVMAASLKLGNTRMEVSAFNGEEPIPTKVDLPIGEPNSYGARLIEEFSPDTMAMVSYAFIQDAEHLEHLERAPPRSRYSASLYTTHDLFRDWKIHNTVIFGLISKLDHSNWLGSFVEEFEFHNAHSQFFGRIEVLQRTPNQLLVGGIGDLDTGRWLVAMTWGYIYTLAKVDDLRFGLGLSVTKDFLPGSFIAAYEANGWTEKIFLRINGMKMFDF